MVLAPTRRVVTVVQHESASHLLESARSVSELRANLMMTHVAGLSRGASTWADRRGPNLRNRYLHCNAPQRNFFHNVPNNDKEFLGLCFPHKRRGIICQKTIHLTLQGQKPHLYLLYSRTLSPRQPRAHRLATLLAAHTKSSGSILLDPDQHSTSTSDVAHHFSRGNHSRPTRFEHCLRVRF